MYKTIQTWVALLEEMCLQLFPGHLNLDWPHWPVLGVDGLLHIKREFRVWGLGFRAAVSYN